MTSESPDEFNWTVRTFIYQFIVEHERPPSVAETAAGLEIGVAETEAAYRRLHEQHAILLEPARLDVHIANPFSGVPTPFRVHTNGRTYWANCAWDMLGIPAALGSDARIEAVYEDAQTPAEIHVEHGAIQGNDEVIHVPIPFRAWHDDLVRT